MLNKYGFFHSLALVLTFLGALLVSGSVGAQIPADAAPFTVTDVIIDKTDKNAVMARDQAIVEARRTAFLRLAEKSMSPEAFKSFTPPPDETIGPLVQDFQIKNEQISPNRYVANFTVRFNPEVVNYIKTSPDAVAPVDVGASQPAEPPADHSSPVIAGGRDVLVLPYFHDISGKKLLWEDPNPWRDAWQATGNSTPFPGLTITVPLGDLADVSSGSTEAVWSGDYSVLEKIRTNYNASEIAITVANKSGIYTRVELYIYKDGKLERKKTVIPYISESDDANPFQPVIEQVIRAIQSPDPYETPAALPPADDFIKPVVVEPVKEVPAPPPEKITIEATMNFETFTQWLEVQRRLISISPTLNVEIASLTKNAARFTVTYNDSLPAFKTALAEKGLMLSDPVVEVDESVLGSDKPTQRAYYELKLLRWP